MNTLPIEMFLDKARIAIKSGQKSVNLDIKEVNALYDSLAIVMTRLAGKEQPVQKEETIQVKMDGGIF